MNTFKKGDRVRHKEHWSLPKREGTVISVKGEHVQWHVDGYPYSTDDFHEHHCEELEPIGSRTTGSICHCKKCNAPNPWAVPNQPDKKTYICFDCR